MCMLSDQRVESRPLAMAKADHRDAHRQLPVRDGHKVLAVATLKDPATGKLWGLIPQTQLVRATAAAPH